MDITWLGHASVRIRSGQTSLVMDPFSDSIGLRIPPQHAQANVVTISGPEPEVSATGALADDPAPIVINGPGEYEAAGLRIKGIRTPRYAPEGEVVWNTAYVVELEGITLSHLGDPGRLLSAREVEDLASPHILILPVGSKTGFSAADAVEMINSISPRVVIPIHYAHDGNQSDLRELAPFLAELGAKPPEAPNRLTITRANLPEELLVSVLQPAAVLI